MLVSFLRFLVRIIDSGLVCKSESHNFIQIFFEGGNLRKIKTLQENTLLYTEGGMNMQTLPKALRTQALTALGNNFGLVLV